MSAFCEECPLRGECSGDVGRFYGVSMPVNQLELSDIRDNDLPEIQKLTAGQFYDSYGNMSEIIRDVEPVAFRSQMDNCPGPQEEAIPRRFRSDKHLEVCGVVGRDATLNPTYMSAYKRRMNERLGTRHINRTLRRIETQPLNRPLLKYGAGVLTSSGLLITAAVTKDPAMAAFGASGLLMTAPKEAKLTVGKLVPVRNRPEEDIDND